MPNPDNVVPAMPDAVTIYHNPRCSKSRAALELLNQRDFEVTVVEYLKNPITKETVQEVLHELQCQPREIMRKSESKYKELNLGDESLTDDQLIDAIVENPILLERPIVRHNQEAAIGRPIDKVIELLD